MDQTDSAAAANHEMVTFEVESLKKRLAESKTRCEELISAKTALEAEVNALQREHSAKVQAMATELERVRAQLQRLPEETEYRRMCEKVTARQKLESVSSEHCAAKSLIEKL